MTDAERPAYTPGDRVRVRSDSPEGHHRTPRYVKGRSGRVDSLCGVFSNPESRAYGGTGAPKQPLYRVEFDQRDIWTRYDGPGADKIYVDIYQHWLDPA